MTKKDRRSLGPLICCLMYWEIKVSFRSKDFKSMQLNVATESFITELCLVISQLLYNIYHQYSPAAALLELAQMEQLDQSNKSPESNCHQDSAMQRTESDGSENLKRELQN